MAAGTTPLEQSSANLSRVLEALSDATRRKIVAQLALKDYCCGSFAPLGPKTRLTYHFNRLREAGLIEATRNGRYQILTLKRRQIDSAFPGLLKAVLKAAEDE